MLYILNIILKLLGRINNYLLEQIKLLSVRKKYNLTKKRLLNILIRLNIKLYYLILKQLKLIIILKLLIILKRKLKFLKKYLRFVRIKFQLNYFYIVYKNLKIDRFLRFNTIDFIRHYLEFFFFFLENKFKKIYLKLKNWKNLFINAYISYLFEIIFLRISLIIFYFYSCYKIFINNLFLVDTPFDAVMSPDRKEFERSNWTRFIPIPFLETVEFIVRPYWRYINTIQRSLINFKIINRLIYYLFLGETLSKFFFLINKFIKKYFLILRSFLINFIKKINYLYIFRIIIYLFIFPLNRLNYVFFSCVLHFKFIIDLIFNFLLNLIFLFINFFYLIRFKTVIFNIFNNFNYIFKFNYIFNLLYNFSLINFNFKIVKVNKYKNIGYVLKLLFNISLLLFMIYILFYYNFIYIYFNIYLCCLCLYYFIKYPNKNVISFFKTILSYKVIGYNLILLDELYRIEINYLLFALKKKYITKIFYEVYKKIIQYNYYFYKNQLINQCMLFSLNEQKYFNITNLGITKDNSLRMRSIYLMNNLNQIKVKYEKIDDLKKLNFIFLNHLYCLIFLYSVKLIDFKELLIIYKYLYLNYDICCVKLNYKPLYENIFIFSNTENLREELFFSSSNNYLSLIHYLYLTQITNYNYLHK